MMRPLKTDKYKWLLQGIKHHPLFISLPAPTPELPQHFTLLSVWQTLDAINTSTYRIVFSIFISKEMHMICLQPIFFN